MVSLYLTISIPIVSINLFVKKNLKEKLFRKKNNNKRYKTIKKIYILKLNIKTENKINFHIQKLPAINNTKLNRNNNIRLLNTVLIFYHIFDLLISHKK